jgi:transcriptional regulator with XRE-family HTH domain
MGLNDFIKVGNKIKIIRKSKGISQKYMAEEVLKIPRSTYSNYENDNRVPDVDTLKKIAAALEVSEEKLLGHSLSTKKDFYFNINTVRDLIYDLYEEIYNHSHVKDDIKITAKDFVYKDKYFMDGVINSFIKLILVNTETLKRRILEKDNTPAREKIFVKYAPEEIIKDKNNATMTHTHQFELGTKLNNRDFLKHKIEEYENYLHNIENGIDNYELIENGLKEARNEYQQDQSEDKDAVKQATQEDIDKFMG